MGIFGIVFSLITGVFTRARVTKYFHFALTHWKQVLVLLVALHFLYVQFAPRQFLFGIDTLPSLRAKIEKTQDQLAESKRQFAVCKEGNDKLSQAIEQQNEQIAKWGELTDKIDQSTAELGKKIDRVRTQTSKDVKDILTAPAPQTCEAAMEYLREYSKELKWSN